MPTGYAQSGTAGVDLYNPPVVGSVRFAYDATADFMTQSGVPYALGGDAAGDDYLPWTPAPGSHTLTATPFSAASGTGTAGSPLTVAFTVVNTPPSGAPVANAGSVGGRAPVSR